jgi:leader peptidase (prepilin peptidase) / N-methyltransferase
MMTLIDLVALLLGLAFGSFGNVIVFRARMPKANLISPSCCLACGAKISARDNVPVISWLLLKGKCRSCGAPISPIYPAVELATGVLFVAFVNLPSPLGDSRNETDWATGLLVAVALCWLACAGVALAAIDFRDFRLPNQLVFSLYVVAAVIFLAASFIQVDFGAMLRGLLGAGISLLIYGAIVLIAPSGMGVGDLKLSGALGLYLGWFGWGSLFLGWLFAFGLGALFGLGILLFKRVKVRTAIAFGPWMIVGAFLAVLFGNSIWEAYLQVLQQVLI